MENSKELLKEISAIRAFGDKGGYRPYDKHKNTLYFANDEGKLYFNNNVYGTNPNIIEWVSIDVDSYSEMFSNNEIKLEGEEYYDIAEKMEEKHNANEPIHLTLCDSKTTDCIFVKLIPNKQTYNACFTGVVIKTNGDIMYFSFLAYTEYSSLGGEPHQKGVITIYPFRIKSNDILYKSNIQKISEEEYDALETKDPNTLYCIPEEG